MSLPRIIQGQKRRDVWGKLTFGDWPNAVSESTFSNLTELWGENSESSSLPVICVQKRTHRVSQNSLTLPKSSVSSLLRNSTLETVFIISALIWVATVFFAGDLHEDDGTIKDLHGSAPYTETQQSRNTCDCSIASLMCC